MKKEEIEELEEKKKVIQKIIIKSDISYELLEVIPYKFRYDSKNNKLWPGFIAIPLTADTKKSLKV